MKTLELLIRSDEEGRTLLCAPGPGFWRNPPVAKARVFPGADAGTLDVLGVQYKLCVPTGTGGVVVERPGLVASNQATDYGAVLMVLGEDTAADGVASDGQTLQDLGSDLVFRAPSAGRFYVRPSPDKEPFVSEGDEIKTGTTVYLLEVMKTFSRVSYEGQGLPERARVVKILVSDGDDLDEGQKVLVLESL